MGLHEHARGEDLGASLTSLSAVKDFVTELLKNNLPCATLHGGMGQDDRDSTIADFKCANTSLLVATSVAARGLDVKDLCCVINYEVPNHYEDYVHRVGRTGRASCQTPGAATRAHGARGQLGDGVHVPHA